MSCSSNAAATWSDAAAGAGPGALLRPFHSGGHARDRRGEPLDVASWAGEEPRPLQSADDQQGSIADRADVPQGAFRPALLDNALKPHLAVVEELHQRCLHRSRQGLELGRQHAAQAHLARAEYLRVQVYVAVEPGESGPARRVERGERVSEPGGPGDDQGLA